MKNLDFYKTNSPDLNHAVEISHRVWWVGSYIPDDMFQCHVYLIENGDQSALIDIGGYLTFERVLEKIEEVIPFSKIKFFICHHQDPDITSALKIIDNMPGRCKDAVVVTHWRAKALIKHYALKMPFFDIEEHAWMLDIGGRLLRFVFTPYLHFPGAFCTFDESSGIMFTSDLFGGLTSRWSLVARDESYFEDIRPFHEHYMPSKEILFHGIVKLERYPIKIIAPQHGSIIPEDLVKFMIGKLKQIDCGIFALATDKTDILRLSFLNKTLKDITNTMIIYRDFHDIAVALLDIFKRTLPAVSIEFYAKLEDNVLCFAPDSRYHGVVMKETAEFLKILGAHKDAWFMENRQNHKKIFLPSGITEIKSNIKTPCLLIPLFSNNDFTVKAIAIIRLVDDIEIDTDIEAMLKQMSETLDIAVERELMYRVIDNERHKLYEHSTKDHLTGLYNRAYMEDSLKRLMDIHDRDKNALITLAMLDLDYFKRINDTYGHAMGDEVLKKTGETLRGSIRVGDIAVRYGGEEFAVFLVGCSMSGCLIVSEKIRRKINEMTFEGPLKNYSVTVSIGIAERRQKETFEEFMLRADQALYQAKVSGRNRVVVSSVT